MATLVAYGWRLNRRGRLHTAGIRAVYYLGAVLLLAAVVAGSARLRSDRSAQAVTNADL